MAGRFDNSIVTQVQQATDIVDVIGEHVKLVKKGREMVGLCPFHDDHKPSLNVSITKQIFKCYACGAGGNVFTFIRMRENLSFRQALERLAERAGIKIEPIKSKSSGGDRSQEQQVDPNRLAKANAWACEHFEKNLKDKVLGKEAREYLAERQISAESIEKWRIGLAVGPEDMVRAAESQKGSMEMLSYAGFAVKQGGRYGDRFVNRLMFPIFDVTGRVIGFGGRTLDGADAKYINSPATVLFDKSYSLYGLDKARHEIVRTATAVVVEGYTDCIMAHQLGVSNVVAALGTSFTAGHGRILRRYAKRIVLVFDSDVAGRAAANRALDVCLSQHIDIKIASVPEGKDPCDFLLSAGKEKFAELIDGAVDVFEYKWNKLVGDFAAEDTLAGRKAAKEEFLQTIAIAVRSGNLAAIDKGLIVNRLSRIIGVDSREINSELKKRIARAGSISSEKPQNRQAQAGAGLRASAECEVLEVLLSEPVMSRYVKGVIGAEDFSEPVFRDIAEAVFESFANEREIELAGILSRIESPETCSLAVALAESGEQKGNFKSRLNGALEVMKKARPAAEKIEIKTAEDQKRFLRRVCENTGKKNPHNLGIV